MPQDNKPTILRRSQLLELLNISNTTLYRQTLDGLIPPPISLGKRAVGWLADEVESVLCARIEGRSDEEICELVSALVANRRITADRS